MTRTDCFKWMEANGYPEPPRSACFYCPYHSNKEWNRLKTESPEEFAQAVEFEKSAQERAKECEVLRGTPFLHNSKVPLDEIDFTDKHNDQFDFGFISECEGMCGN